MQIEIDQSIINNILLTVCSLGMLYLVVFINKLNLPGEKAHFKTAVDDFIPSTPAFIIPYFSYYPYLALSWVYLFLTKSESYREFVISFGLMTLIANVVFVTMKSAAPREDVKENSPYGRMVKWHYEISNPINAFPSLHVAHSICISIFLSMVLPEYMFLWGTIALLISLSTVMIKTHYFLDVVGGIILSSFISYIVILSI